MYREDTSTLTHSLNLNDPHMQMSYIWARMKVKRAPGIGALVHIEVSRLCAKVYVLPAVAEFYD